NMRLQQSELEKSKALFHFAVATLSHGSDVSELMAANRNLTNLNDKLSVLENQITDLTAVNQELETLNQELETLNQDLETLNQDLETERKNSRGQIQNISRAQWSIDQYCPEVKKVSERRCQPCQKGWRLFKSSCYLTNNDRSDQKTWEESREDCRGRSSDLVVVHSRGEQRFLHLLTSLSNKFLSEGGRWKWINGSDLTESVSGWIHEPPSAADGQCVVYDMFKWRYGWRSESCAERRRWICKNKALSV
uniref:C-type lectin domain-containing protein n=1 Tax=Sander lucioperca TaxID=283035 RepID=A0A8C9Z6J6_SANLU